MKKIVLGLVLVVSSLTAAAQVGVGTTTPKSSAALDVTSTSKGFLPPRMTSAQRNSISLPVEGLTIYNTDDNCLNVYVGYWRNLCASDITASTGTITHNGLSYEDIYSAATGLTWLDRNLGASQVAVSAGSGDASSFGDLYQWGRATDGHEKRTSLTTTINASTATVNGGNAWDGLFILEASSPYDWLSIQDDTLWQGLLGTNNPCPTGYRIPTEAEWQSEQVLWSSSNSIGAFESSLKLPGSGRRDLGTGGIGNLSSGYYWSSGVSGIYIRNLFFSINAATITSINRSYGMSVRCIKD